MSKDTSKAAETIKAENESAALSARIAELTLLNKRHEKCAEELATANKMLELQNIEKERLATELLAVNGELALRNNEKGDRAAELAIANEELVFQNREKEQRAAELVIANKELAFQNSEKEKRAAELVFANKELFFQNSEKEKRAAELVIANKELESFTFISSHDLQEPLRKIQLFSSRILSDDYNTLSDTAKIHFERIQNVALHMQTLINDLLAYSRTSIIEKKFETRNLKQIVDEVLSELHEELTEKKAVIVVDDLCDAEIIPFQFRQMLQNLIGNSLKFSKPEKPPRISIKSKIIDNGDETNNSAVKNYCQITISDNGIGFEHQHKDRIFEIFQRLNEKDRYEGTGLGLTIVKKIVENHKGMITATGEPNKGATFDIFIPKENS